MTFAGESVEGQLFDEERQFLVVELLQRTAEAFGHPRADRGRRRSTWACCQGLGKDSVG